MALPRDVITVANSGAEVGVAAVQEGRPRFTHDRFDDLVAQSADDDAFEERGQRWLGSFPCFVVPTWSVHFPRRKRPRDGEDHDGPGAQVSCRKPGSKLQFDQLFRQVNLRSFYNLLTFH